MPQNRHPELDGDSTQPLYTFELKSRKQSLLNKGLWTLLGLGIGIGITVGMAVLLPGVDGPQPSTLASDDPFKQGASQAMSAAELTQTAEFKEDWSKVAILWQQAISHMQTVPKSHPNYAIAQQKLIEYGRNLSYARSNVNVRASMNPNQLPYWTIGSDRELVLELQGMPDRMSQYNTTCKEVMHYGNSMVELKNGYVADYSDVDNNLNVLAGETVALSVRPQNSETWTVGSSQADVFSVQGTPNRTSTYQDAVTLHYGDSTVQLMDNRVIGYTNLDGNLQVAMAPAIAPEGTVPPTWSIGSTRLEVLKAEQTPPTAISRSDTRCEEVFNFDSSIVTFRQGLVAEYSDSGQNLKIQSP